MRDLVDAQIYDVGRIRREYSERRNPTTHCRITNSLRLVANPTYKLMPPRGRVFIDRGWLKI